MEGIDANNNYRMAAMDGELFLVKSNQRHHADQRLQYK